MAHADLAVVESSLECRQPEAQVQPVADEPPSGVRRELEPARDQRGSELRHLRRALPTEPYRPLTSWEQRPGAIHGLRAVLEREVRRHPQDAGLGLPLCAVQRVELVEEVDPHEIVEHYRGHASFSLEQVFESTFRARSFRNAWVADPTVTAGCAGTSRSAAR